MERKASVGKTHYRYRIDKVRPKWLVVRKQFRGRQCNDFLKYKFLYFDKIFKQQNSFNQNSMLEEKKGLREI